MKKVFAFISVFALAIAMLGLTPKHLSADEAKWTKDPTLGENDIPLYIMDSIYSTFPFDYDNVAKPDANWQGAARMYPWNETKLQVKQISEDGAFTGKEYAIYFTGNLSMKEAGTGNNILFYNVDESGNILLQRSNGGRMTTSGGVPMDPSLSHMRTNLSDQDITFDAIELWSANGSGNGSNLYNRLLVFDGQGRMVRGAGLNELYDKVLTGEDATEVDENRIAPQFCYVNGEVTEMGPDTVCDKKKVEKLDEEGNPVVNPETGETEMVETDEDDILYERFIWQYVSPEEFASEEFVGVNNGYLNKGWDAQKWDYAFDDADVEGGKICIAFVGSEGSNYKLSAAQLEVYTETVKANTPEGEEPVLPTKDTTRKMARMITVPAHGRTFDFGYLDRGVTSGKIKFMKMFNQGYAHGRLVDENGNGMAYAKAVNYSAKPLYTKDVAYNGASYQLLEGKNVIEVMQGEKIFPGKNLVYTGMSRYWADEADLTSFKADPAALDLYITTNGVPMVQPATGWTSFESMRDDFMADLNAYLAKRDGFTLNEETGKFEKKNKAEDGTESVEEFVPVPTPVLADGITTGGAFYTRVNNTICEIYGTKGFLNEPDMMAKWKWMFEYMNVALGANGLNLEKVTYLASPGNYTYSLWGFLTESPEIKGWPASKADFSNGKARGWLDERTNVQKWDQYSIDTAMDPIDKNYEVAFKAVNATTGVESEIVITYVVVDEYTPIMKVNKGNLYLEAEGAIDPTLWAQAWNARYDGTIKGSDISSKIIFTSDTLDFAEDAKYQQGAHKVTATVRNVTKEVVKSFVVEIEDNQAPIVSVQNITINYGEHFDPEMAVTYAMDNVDGNLLQHVSRQWLTVEGKYSTTPANSDFVDKKGKACDKHYDLELIVNDEAGNEVRNNFRLTIVRPTSLDTQSALDELKGDVSTLSESLEALEAKLAALQEKVDSLVAKANAKCGSKSQLMVEFLAATGLLVVLLRRRH